MRIAAYASSNNPWASAFLASAEATGNAANVLWRRGSLWTRDQRCHDVDLVVSSGARGAHGQLIRDYSGWGVPVVILDLARHRAVDGMYGFYLGGIHALPPIGVPGRRERFAPDAIKPVREQSPGDCILVLGQRPNDASHNLDAAGLDRWLADTTARVAAETGLPVVYRPHPRGEPTTFSHPHELADRTQPLSFDGVARVVTYCSTAGYEAILAGIPVTCHESAFYAPWASLDRDRTDLVDRVLATQWTKDEVEAGVAWDFISWWIDVWRDRWDGAPPPLRKTPVYVERPTVVGVYADETQEWAAELVSAIEASGSECVWQAKYRATQLDAQKWSAILCYGARKGHAQLLAGCSARTIPALIGDLPRVRNLPGSGLYGGYYGFFAGDLHALPPVGVPGRRNALAPDLIEPVRFGGDHILVLGQKPGDASHGLTISELNNWLSERAALAIESTGLPVIYRPHPYAKRPGTLSVPHEVQPPTEPLSFDGAALVVCYSSTGGFEAILAGVPVDCHSGAFYAPWADLQGDREDLLDRVLATQWNAEERTNGSAWDFLWRWMSGQLDREVSEQRALAHHPLAVA